MTQDVADLQACANLGTVSFTATLNERMLKTVESRFASGRWMTIAEFLSVVGQAEHDLKTLGKATHPPGKWSLLVPVQHAKALYFAMHRVPGLQPDLPLTGDLQEQVRVEKARARAALVAATRIADQLTDGTIKYSEELESALTATGDADATREALKLLRSAAPRLSDGGTPLPSLARDAIASSLPSCNGFRLLVRPKGGVDVVNGLVSLTVDKVLDAQHHFKTFTGLLQVKCPRTDDQRMLIVAQMANQPVEVLLAGEVGTFLGRRGQKFDLTLVSLKCAVTLGDMLKMAVSGARDMFSDQGDETN